ncbi:MAG TPA: hypothetical protein ENH82_08940 [bacterium]|nr:hypothetical protein [bacterium]
MPFTKGQAKQGGRSKGKENKATQESRELLNKVLSGEITNIKAALKKVKEDDDFKYLSILEKWMSYVIPKKKDITSDGEQIPSITINEITKK